ncbi:MAG: anaerobic ribonucleoside-triphosphate reductase [Patescibacteria group bacterium]
MALVKIVDQEKNFCHDCQKEMKLEGEEIKNGVLLAYENGGEKLNVFKCQDCFEKSKELKNYQSCEVYSRIVGYLRPVQQWNIGKKQEFKERKEYGMPKECC